MRYLWTLIALVFSGGAAEFHVSPKGRDTQAGTTRTQPWKTLDRVNQHIATNGLAPGDRILLLGGATFAGHLRVEHAGGGSDTAPVVISSYGRGRATLKPGKETGILIRETPWVTISNLDLVASAENLGDGIRCDRHQASSQRLPGITIRDCSIRGFGWHGIMIDSAGRSNGFEQVMIERCVTSTNRYAGIMVYGDNPTGRHWRPHAQISIVQCTAVGNPGDPEELRHHSGSGILLDGVDTASVQHCVAAGNGAACRSDRGGPVGIWAHASRGVIIERCESYGNNSLLRDGGGFDLDGGCEECVLRWNFSHHNHGPGFLVYTYAGAAYADRDCHVYGNVSWNDGAKSSGYAGIQVGAEEGCRITGLQVERNTVISPRDSVGSIRVIGHSVQASFRSNLVVAPVHGTLLALSGFQHQLRFIGNRYWRDDGNPVFLIDNQWAIPSLDSWRNATGPDYRFASEDELFSDPQLRIVRPPDARVIRLRPVWPRISHRFVPAIGAPAVLLAP